MENYLECSSDEKLERCIYAACTLQDSHLLKCVHAMFANLFSTKHNVVSPHKSVQIKSLAGLFCVLSVFSHPVDKFYNKI